MKYYNHLSLVSFIVIIADQFCKYWLVSEMMANNFIAIKITSFFNIVMVWNRGVSFGLFSQIDARIPLIALSLIVAISLTFWHRKSTNWRISCGVGMVVGGAFGNVIDRLHYGAVADFFDFHVMNYHWPSFNIADMCIMMGVCLLIFSEIKQGRVHKMEQKSTKQP